jgi:hypothetical protein
LNLPLQIADVSLSVSAFRFAHDRDVALNSRRQVLELFLLGKNIALARLKFFFQCCHRRLGLWRPVHQERNVHDTNLEFLGDSGSRENADKSGAE